MKKTYKTPKVTEIPPDKGRLEVTKSGESRLIRTEHYQYNEGDTISFPYDGMSDKEIRKHVFDSFVKQILFRTPDNIADDNDPQLKAIFQNIFDSELSGLQKKHPGYSVKQLVQNLKGDFEEYALNKYDPRNQIRARRFLEFLNERELNIVEPDPKIQNRYSKFSVKSIIMAYYYMHKSGIYPIPELNNPALNLNNIFSLLNNKYGFSANSFKNDWNPIFGKSGYGNRTKSTQVPNIEKAIEFMELDFSAHPGIKKAITLASEELEKANLNS